MTDLATIFASLQRHHVATPSCPLPEPEVGVEWIWASNGVFKRGVGPTLDVLILVQPTRPVPGLAPLEAHVRFRTHGGRIPGKLLGAILEHARQAGEGDGPLVRPIEQQYFITWCADQALPFRVALPPQDASATRVRYEMRVQGQVLVDIHSHHRMRAYFSPTDDRDDQGLSISAVVGNIFEQPEVCVRANVYGQRMVLPALTVFDHLSGCRDAERRGRRVYASTDH